MFVCSFVTAQTVFAGKVEDIESSGYNFTDGCGDMSLEVARRVVQELKVKTYDHLHQTHKVKWENPRDTDRATKNWNHRHRCKVVVGVGKNRKFEPVILNERTEK